MSLDEEIQDRFLTDSETILKAHLDNLEGMFQFHEDGTMEILGKYRELSPEDQILIYLIARRYQFDGGLAESESITYPEIYARFPEKDKSTVRGYFMNLRKANFATKTDEGHTLTVERLPEAIERIEGEIQED